MSVIKEDIVVFGKPGYNTLGLIRCLHKEKINFFLLIVRFNLMYATIKSKGVVNYKIIDSEEDAIAFLLNNSADNKKIIIPTSDKSELILDQHYNLLKDKYIFPNASEQGRVSYCMDKQVMLNYASDCGILTPRTITYNTKDNLPQDIIFPCLIKPQNSCNGSKSDIAICSTYEELLNAVKCSKYTTSFLIQEYVNRDYDVLVIGSRLRSTGKVIFQGVFRKERWSEIGGDGSFGLIDADVLEYLNIKPLEDFLISIGYYGPFSMEFGASGNKLYFFEINMRNDGTSHYFQKLGTNVAIVWALDALSLNICDKIHYHGKYIFIDEIGDILNVFTSKLTFKEWWNNLKIAKVYKYFDSKDILPFLILFPRRFLKTIYLILRSYL